MTSRNPSVVMKAVRAPRRSMRALVTSVVPWITCEISPSATPARLAASLDAGENRGFGAGVIGEHLCGRQAAGDVRARCR